MRFSWLCLLVALWAAPICARVQLVDRWWIQYTCELPQQNCTPGEIQKDQLDLLCDPELIREAAYEHKAFLSLKNFMDNVPYCHVIFNDYTVWSQYHEVLTYVTGLEMQHMHVIVLSYELNKPHLIPPVTEVKDIGFLERVLDGLFVMGVLTESVPADEL